MPESDRECHRQPGSRSLFAGAVRLLGRPPRRLPQGQTLGFDAIEVFPTSAADLDACNRTLLSDHGLLAAMGTPARGWLRKRLNLTVPGLEAREEARDFIRSIVDLAGSLEMRFPRLSGSMQGRWTEDVDRETATGYLADALEELGTFASHGVPLIFEPLNRYETNLANTVEAGVAQPDVVDEERRPARRPVSMNIEGDIAAAIRAGKGHIGHVHFVDSNRRPAGAAAHRSRLDRPGPRRDRLRWLRLGRGVPYLTPTRRPGAIKAFRRFF